MRRVNEIAPGADEKKFFGKVLINRPWRFDSQVFSFYILSVKGVAKELAAAECERCFLEGEI